MATQIDAVFDAVDDLYYRYVLTTAKVIRAKQDTQIQTQMGGLLICKTGDYLIKENNGRLHTLTEKQFKKEFKKVKDPETLMIEETTNDKQEE